MIRHRTMNELQFGGKVRALLDQGAHLEPRIRERLRAARERALEHSRPEREPALGWADNVLGRFGGVAGFSLRLLLPLALALAGVVAIYQWQQNQRAAELVEIDAQLLADDLPIDAYLDRGFEAWLRKRSAR
jgi:hypothetical protein